MRNALLDAPSRARAWIVAVGALWLAAVATPATAAVPDPVVTGPIPSTAPPGDPSRNYVFFASHLDLAGYGYVEEEYFIEGTANRYSTPAGQTGTVIDSGHPYRTRIVVRRPASAERFNGTVVVEWLNVTNGLDMENTWFQIDEHLLRSGYAWVGVSAQRVGVNRLRTWNPARYGTLDVSERNASGTETITNDALSYDVFSQAAQAVRAPVGVDPLGGLNAQVVIATGHSQSSSRLSTYVNAIQPLAGVIDAFALHGSLGNNIRADLLVPVWKVNSEFDVDGLEGPVRRPDAELFRTWEVAGTSHNDLKSYSSRVPLQLRDIGTNVEASLNCTFMPAGSAVPFHYAMAAGLDHLVRWVKDGTPMPSAPFLNASGVNSQPMIVHSNPVPYDPVTLDTTQATLTVIESETIEGVTGPTREVPSADWAWASCSAANPFPGTPDPTRICVRGGFEPNRVYQVVFTTRDPYVLGIGFAAFRDLASFFKYETQDDVGTPNPVANRISWVIGRGVSQSGNFLRAFLHLGFNQDEARRQVQDGNWPIIAGRRVALNLRFAMPDGVLKLYEPGSEGPQWWHRFPDHVRGLPPRGILDRCEATKTCPRIIEHFGAAEIWGLKLGPEWVGTHPTSDVPLPKNVRRNWVMKDVPPPPSRWPQLHRKELVVPTKEAMGFPTIPGVPPTAPTGLINPVLDYDFGPEFDYSDGSGVQTIVPPIVKQVIPALVPRVDADGNEVGGVPVVLRDAPLGTYLGWNITAAGFHAGKICNYAGGMIPFAGTRAERLASGDPRLSLEERYGDHAGYVAAVEKAAANAVAQGFLLQADADALIAAAQASNVLNP